MMRSTLVPVVVAASIGLAGCAVSAAETPTSEPALATAVAGNEPARTGADEEIVAKKKAYDSQPRPEADATAAEAAWMPLYEKRIAELDWAPNYKPSAAALVKGSGDELARVEMDQPTASGTIDAINQCSWAMLASDELKSGASTGPAVAGLAKLAAASPPSKEGVDLLSGYVTSGDAGALSGFIDANDCDSLL